MAIAATQYPHIEMNHKGVPIIAGTTTKVVELVMGQQAFNSTPEELQADHPYLTKEQIRSALAYYSDHQEELDEDIRRREKEVDEIEQEILAREAIEGNPFKERLKAKGLL